MSLPTSRPSQAGVDGGPCRARSSIADRCSEPQHDRFHAWLRVRVVDAGDDLDLVEAGHAQRQHLATLVLPRAIRLAIVDDQAVTLSKPLEQWFDERQALRDVMCPASQPLIELEDIGRSQRLDEVDARLGEPPATRRHLEKRQTMSDRLGARRREGDDEVPIAEVSQGVREADVAHRRLHRLVCRHDTQPAVVGEPMEQRRQCALLGRERGGGAAHSLGDFRGRERHRSPPFQASHLHRWRPGRGSTH